MSTKLNGHGPTRRSPQGGSRLSNGIPRLPPINTPASVLSGSNSRDYSKSKLMTHRRAKEMQALLTNVLYQKANVIEEQVIESNKKRPPTAPDPDYPVSVSKHELLLACRPHNTTNLSTLHANLGWKVTGICIIRLSWILDIWISSSNWSCALITSMRS